VKLRLLFLVTLLFLIKSSLAQLDSAGVLMRDSIAIDTSKVSQVLRYAETFHGAAYCFGSCGPRSFDCSGFVMHVFGKYGIQLPHGSATLAGICDDVKLKKVQPGDLLFFAGRKVSKKSIGHVSIVKSVQEGRIEIIHATVQSGVISEFLESSEYFSKRFIRAGRIPALK
jgi:cell wall-associated NlpC family hydrolase